MTQRKKFTFEAILVDDDTQLNDQNVYKYYFKNLSEETQVLLNNTIVLNFGEVWDEPIFENEKTCTIYDIKFRPKVGEKLLQVIQKMPYFDEK